MYWNYSTASYETVILFSKHLFWIPSISARIRTVYVTNTTYGRNPIIVTPSECSDDSKL